MRTFIALLILLASARPVFAQVPGCINGVLADPKAYFFHLIGRQDGQPADDFAEVLRASGLPAGYLPHVTPTDNGYYGLTQQIGGSGRIAGRIFLPTADPDDLGYYSHPVSPLRDGPTPGSLLWEWRDLGGPPYAPRPCGAVTPPPVVPPPPVTPPPVDTKLADAVAALTAKLEAIQIRVEQLEVNPPRVLTMDALERALANLAFDCTIGRTGASFLSHGHGCTVTVTAK